MNIVLPLPLVDLGFHAAFRSAPGPFDPPTKVQLSTYKLLVQSGWQNVSVRLVQFENIESELRIRRTNWSSLGFSPAMGGLVESNMFKVI